MSLTLEVFMKELEVFISEGKEHWVFDAPKDLKNPQLSVGPYLGKVKMMINDKSILEKNVNIADKK